MPAIFYVSYAAIWLLAIVEGLLLLLVYRHFGLQSMQSLEGVHRDGLHVGAVAPPVVGVAANAAPYTWAPDPSHNSLLVFASPTCGPCEQVIPALTELAAMNGDLRIAVVSEGGLPR